MGTSVGKLLPGPATVSVGGVDIGSYVHGKSLIAKLKTKFVESMDAQYGDLLPVAAYQESQGLEVEAEFLYLDWAKIAKMLPGLTLVSGTTYKGTFGLRSGTEVTSMSLAIAPRNSALALIATLTIPAVYISTAENDFPYGGAKPQTYTVKFKAMADTVTGADGSFIGSWGDPAASADLVLPTCSSVTPADGASGVSKTDPLVWTMSKDLDASTVNTGSVIVAMTDPAGTVLTDVAGAVVLSNNGASTTISFTPTSAMTGSKLHCAMLLPTIKDTHGNRLAAFSNANKTSLDFTTTA